MEEMMLFGLEIERLKGNNRTVILRFAALPEISAEGDSVAEAFAELKEEWAAFAAIRNRQLSAVGRCARMLTL